MKRSIPASEGAPPSEPAAGSRPAWPSSHLFPQAILLVAAVGTLLLLLIIMVEGGQTRIRTMIAVLLLPLLAAAWLYFLHRVRKWRLALQAEQEALAVQAERLADLSMKLDKEVRQRTSQLEVAQGEHRKVETELNQSIEQLRQIQKMEAVGRLAGGVAHDFNNMLCVILGFADVARASIESDDAVAGCLDEIKKAGERARSLTSQLLAFSRKQVLQPVVHNVNNTIADMEKMLRSMIGEDVALVTKLDPALPNVRVDPGQIQQVLMNLAANARDAMPEGGTLTIETGLKILQPEQRFDGERVLPERCVSIRVIDTGTGMSKETMAHIFEPFFTTKPKGQGTGLGLSTVYGIVRQSNGVIWAQSEPGKGTQFEILLPSTEEQETPVQKLSASRTWLEGAGTILLVEDEEMVRSLTRTTLTVAGYTVVEASNGVEALERLEQSPRPFDLLLTDVVMPRMDGRSLAQRVQTAYPRLKVLFMSGYTADDILNSYISERRVPLLRKPFTPDELRAKVREILGGAGPCWDQTRSNTA